MIHQQLRNTGSNIVALHIFDPEESMKKKKMRKMFKNYPQSHDITIIDNDESLIKLLVK